MTLVGTFLGESGSRSLARIGCLIVFRRVLISFSRLVALAGSITATPRGRRFVVNVSFADPTSTLTPSVGLRLGQHCSVDGRRVNPARVQDELSVFRPQLGVVPRYGRLTNEYVARSVASDCQQGVPD